MTPAEIKAAKMVVNLDPEEEGIGEVAKANRLRWRSDLAPALLSALEEARADLVKASEERASWQSAALTAGRFREAERARAEAAESALEEARREATDRVAAAWAEADKIGARLAAAESRADALQAEVERTRMELRNVEEILNVERVEATETLTKTRNSLLVELNATAARADAAWRAALEAAAHLAFLFHQEEADPDALPAAIRALPPPSATPNEET